MCIIGVASYSGVCVCIMMTTVYISLILCWCYMLLCISGNVKLSSLSGRFPKNERGSGGTSIRSFNPLSSRSSASLSSNSKRSLISDSFKISKAKALVRV